MKILTYLLLISMFLMPIASAEELKYDAGLITPDNPLWKIELALEEMTEKLMFSKQLKVELQLNHARERIGELEHTEDPDKVSAEYVKVLNRIRSTQDIDYTTATAVQEQLIEHKSKLSMLEAQTAIEPTQIKTSTMLQELSQTQTQVENQATSIMTEENLWWSSLVSKYDIITVPTPVSSFGDYEKYGRYLNEGSTVVDVTLSDGTLLSSYTLHKEDNVVTINTGSTNNYIDKYTIEANQLRKYEGLL